MPRTLPWLTGKAAAKATNLRKHSPAVQCMNSPEEEPSNNELPAPAPFAEQKASPRRRIRAPRTPSTSPPPAPPVEEFMRTGYDKDDGWMMVEDEFYAVAQEFTLPLHRQEYERLKEKARNEGFKIKDLARPTTMLAMRKELRQKKEAEALRTKHKIVLDDMKGGLIRDSDSEEDAISEREDDPWYGTTLHGLMASPQKAQTALVGLEKVQSTTRAAAGFSQPDHSPVRQRSSGILSDDARILHQENGTIIEQASDDDNDLDLDVVPTTSPLKGRPHKKARLDFQASNSSSSFSEPLLEMKSTIAPPLKSKKTVGTGFDDGFDDFLRSSDRARIERKLLSTKPTPKKKHAEVPTFLV